jgi:hypothetical protein
MAFSGPSPRLRVLHIPDFVPWVTGTIARRIAHHNPWMESTICSVHLLREMAWRGIIPGAIDLVHFQLAENGFEFIDHFEGKVPCVATIHHVEKIAASAPSRDSTPSRPPRPSGVGGWSTRESTLRSW